MTFIFILQLSYVGANTFSPRSLTSLQAPGTSRAPSAQQSPTKTACLKASRFQPTPARERKRRLFSLSCNNVLSKKDPMAQIKLFEFSSQIYSVKGCMCTFVSCSNTGDGTDESLATRDRVPRGLSRHGTLRRRENEWGRAVRANTVRFPPLSENISCRKRM